MIDTIKHIILWPWELIPFEWLLWHGVSIIVAFGVLITIVLIILILWIARKMRII